MRIPRPSALAALVPALSLALLLQACASMFGKREDEITVKSEPAGADVYIGLEKAGVTPYTFKLKRNTFDQTYVTLKLEGFESHKFMVPKTLENTAIYNFGFITTTGGTTSFGIDALTGAMFRYSPTGFMVELKKKTAAGPDRTVTPLAFAATAAEELRADIARGDGEFLKAYHGLAFPEVAYADFLAAIALHREGLHRCEDGLRLHAYFQGMLGA